jgi:xanthine/uracil permease
METIGQLIIWGIELVVFGLAIMYGIDFLIKKKRNKNKYH